MNKVGFPAILFLLFLTLKLCGVIHWSWWMVFSPLWIVFALGFLAGLLSALASAIKP